MAWFTRRQGYLFFPLLMLEGLNLHPRRSSAVSAAARSRAAGSRSAMLVVRLALYSQRSSSSCRSAWRSPSSASSWPCSASTWARPSRRTTRACRCCRTDSKVDFLRRQVLTSRNIIGAPAGAPSTPSWAASTTRSSTTSSRTCRGPHLDKAAEIAARILRHPQDPVHGNVAAQVLRHRGPVPEPGRARRPRIRSTARWWPSTAGSS